MSDTFPTGTAYGSQVLTSGDLSVRSVSARNKYTVSNARTSHLSYVADMSDSSVTECSRLISETSNGVGAFSIAVLSADAGEMVKTFKSQPQATEISTGGSKATFGQIGLSFDRDDCAIYFGKDRTFRIMFTEAVPARLVFQCINPENGEYVTKFSCVKEG